MNINQAKINFENNLQSEIKNEIVEILSDRLLVNITYNRDCICIGTTLTITVDFKLDQKTSANICVTKACKPKLYKDVETDIERSHTHTIADDLANKLEEIILQYGMENID